MLTETSCPTGIDDRHDEAAHDRPRPTPSLFGLVRELVDETRTLFRQEMKLARAEVSEKASKAARNTVSIAIGGAVAFLGAMALVAAACAAVWVLLLKAEVDPAVAVWLAPLLVGGLIALIGYAMIQKGLSTLKNMKITPERTADSLKETGQWMHDKVA